MLGFAIIDRQPAADTTAVWVTSRTETFVRNTNAVVIQHDDPEYDTKVRSLTAGRCVVLTHGTEPLPRFLHAVHIDVFDDLLERTAAHQARIRQAIADYSARNRTKLVAPRFLPNPVPAAPGSDEPRFRALTVADYVGAVWTAWLFTEEQRVRRTVSPKTGESPWVMPHELNSPTVADLPPEFADQVKPEPLS